MDNPNNAKKIAMFSIHSDPLECLGSQQAGGQNVYVRSLAEELEKFGWEVDIFTRWDNPRKKQIVQFTKKSRIIRLKGGRVCYIGKEELINILPEIYNSFLQFINEKNPYDLFHGHYWDGGWMGLKASIQFKKPLVANFHSLGIVRNETKKRYKKNKNDYQYLLKRRDIENEIIKNAAKIISLAESEKQDLHHLYGCPLEKCSAIPGGVNIKKWTPLDKKKAREIINGLKENDFILLFVGRLEWRKGIGTLISAARFLKKDIPNIKILIVGGKIFGREKNPDDCKEYRRLAKKAKSEGVSDVVRFVGRTANSKLPVFYSASDALIIPSYYEPFGLVALEGLASKIPVVASNIGGLANIIKDGENGLLFEPRNPVSLKEKIVKIYSSKAFAQEIAKNGYEEAKKYLWKTTAQKISDIYGDLIKKNYENSPDSAV